MQIVENVTHLIGKTPLIKIKNPQNAMILGKCEFLNPSSSIKDRVALAMIKNALEEKKLDKNSMIFEPTSGNTGIGLAMVCASLGLNLTIVMPESMSVERRKLIKAYGASLVLSPANLGMSGAVAKAKELQEQTPGSITLAQFDNFANPKMHEQTTAQEIWEDTDHKVDIFIAGVGTGGTISGVGKALKAKNPNIKIIAVEPSASAVLSGENAGPHKIQGIGAGFIPKVLDTNIYEKIIKVEHEDAFNCARELAKKDGILVGISSGANVFAAKQMAKLHPHATIVTVLCDTGERYLSTDLFEI